MAEGGLEARVEFCGISPWEIEVAHGYLGGVFRLRETEIEQGGGAVSRLLVGLPVEFSDAFFEWFGFKRWERIKSLFKEMKRRRGGGAGTLEIRVRFEAGAAVTFVIDSAERAIFDNSVEKIDYVLESLGHHRGEHGGGALVYRFSPRTKRWVPESVGA